MPRKRRNFTPEQKAEIVRRHMIDKVPVSDLCEEYGLQPSVFHSWHKQVTDNLAVVFEVPSGDWGRAIILLHEMGHLSLSGIKFLPVPGLFGATVSQIALLTEGPRDRRHEVCTRYENQCYGSPDPLELGAFQPPQIYDGQASGINPRRLVARFEAVGSGEARRDMLHNIDNYVCYMYNRWVDRNYCRVEV